MRSVTSAAPVLSCAALRLLEIAVFLLLLRVPSPPAYLTRSGVAGSANGRGDGGGIAVPGGVGASRTAMPSNGLAAAKAAPPWLTARLLACALCADTAW